MNIQQYKVDYCRALPWEKAKHEAVATAVLRLESNLDDLVERVTFDGRRVGAWFLNERGYVQLFVAEPDSPLFRELFIDIEDWESPEFPEWLYLSGNNEYLWLDDGGDSASIYGITTGWGARVELNGFGFIKSFPEGAAGWLEAQKWCQERMEVTVEDVEATE